MFTAHFAGNGGQRPIVFDFADDERNTHMKWLRSLAAVLLGGVLGFFLACAGEGVLPDIGSRSSMDPPSQAAPALHAVVSGPSGSVSTVALEPAPLGTHYLALLLAALVAGYGAARIAGRAAMAHGALTAWPRVLLLVISMMIDADTQVALRPVFDIAIAVAAGAAGGWVSDRRKRSAGMLLRQELSSSTAPGVTSPSGGDP